MQGYKDIIKCDFNGCIGSLIVYEKVKLHVGCAIKKCIITSPLSNGPSGIFLTNIHKQSNLFE